MSLARYFRRNQKQRDVREELDLHIQLETETNIARGMSPAEAKEAALLRLGNRTLIHEEVYRMYTSGILDSMARDFRLATRALLRDPAFTAIAAITIALGIGATIAIFTVVNGILIKPLPYPDPDALVSVWHSAVVAGANYRNANHSASMYVAYAENNRT